MGKLAGPKFSLHGEASGFLPSPNGGFSYGEITPEMASAIRRESGEIRLAKGNRQEGRKHIEDRHGDEVKSAGYDSVEGFVYDITSDFDEIRKGSTGALLLVKHKETGSSQNVFVRLKPGNSGVFYV